jgi:hypothetical protein
MSSMSELDIDVRQAEQDGVDYFATQIYADPTVNGAKVWAIFDVKAARVAEHGIAFVTYADGSPITYRSEVFAAIAVRGMNEVSR